MIRVLLVDDHAVVRTGFRLLLQARPDIAVAGEAESGEAACQRYIELAPDAVIMDIAMPGMGGIEALRRIRAHDPQARVLALSAHDDPMHARRALREGALGFLSKRSAPEALLEAVAAVAGGQRYIELSPDVVIMDIAMPGMGGIEALRRIRAHDPRARVLALSA
ncbi:MAG: response regulator, partial [Steroidobacteraceae bacterium]